jgi:hypothetical protein
VRAARVAVAGLVEMVADDRACAGRDRSVLAAALARVGSATAAATARAGCAAVPPIGAMALGDAAVLDRVRRLLAPPAPAPGVRRLALTAAGVLVALPVLAVLL